MRFIIVRKDESECCRLLPAAVAARHGQSGRRAGCGDRRCCLLLPLTCQAESAFAEGENLLFPEDIRVLKHITTITLLPAQEARRGEGYCTGAAVLASCKSSHFSTEKQDFGQQPQAAGQREVPEQRQKIAGLRVA